jgi:hypothetical protein
MSQTKSIDELVDSLPTSNVTVYLLRALDAVVPGEWQNWVGFKETIRAVTGETEKKTVQKIRDRALELYDDSTQGYQQALWLYQTVDRADSAIGAAAMANKLGEKISFLSFLNQLTPKADTLQSIDLCLKLVVELIALSKINRIAIANVGQLATALTQYQHESLMRIAALVCVDGVIPLGPNFIKTVNTTLGSLTPAALQQNLTFQSINNLIPGGSTDEKLGFIGQSFSAVQGWMENFVTSHHITQQSLVSTLQKSIDIADNNLDYVAAFLDLSTNYYEHTGIQTVARCIIERAAREI